ncbi:MAG: integration host factor subunit alpha [Pseudomonadota bacterium]
MTITKAHLIDSIHERMNLPKNTSARLLLGLFELIKEMLQNGEDVLITGFGKFCVREKKDRRGRHPVTGEHIILDSRRVVTFSCSTILRGKLNVRG